MSTATRTFGGLLSHDGVCLVEYRTERHGIRALNQWMNDERSASIDEALAHLVNLVTALGVSRARIALAIEQFGVFHHVMSLPPAADDVLRPVIARELQRTLGLTDPVFAFTRADGTAANSKTAPQQLFIGGAPKDTIDALSARLGFDGVEIELATIVPKAIHSLYQAGGSTLEPTAVLACLEGGPHLAFFLDGRLELAIDPPIALEGERAPLAVILDQVERGAVYFRQQFRGATATRMLLAAPSGEYDTLAAALEERLSLRVNPLFAGTSSPAAVVAMGAVLEARHAAPLDLFPHPPTLAARARDAMRGPNAMVAGMLTAVVVASIWNATQFVSLGSAQRERDSLRAALSTASRAIEPMRRMAEARADYTRQLEFVTDTRSERAELAGTLHAIAQQAPAVVRFDSLRVSRTAGGWSASIAGKATSATAAQAVRALDTFYQAVRARPGVSGATLDQFDYPVATGADSTRRAGGPVVADFRVSFALTHGAGGVR